MKVVSPIGLVVTGVLEVLGLQMRKRERMVRGKKTLGIGGFVITIPGHKFVSSPASKMT